MVEERFHDQRTSLIRGGDEREQRLFLLTKVRHAVGGKEVAERRSHGFRIVVAVGGISETPRFNERVVVVMRQRDQGGMALNARTVAATRRRGQARALVRRDVRGGGRVRGPFRSWRSPC